MQNLLIEADYRGDLGNGLIRRWSTPADQEKIGQLMGRIFRNNPDQPINVRAVDEARIFMSDDFPFMGAGDIAIVEDTSQPDCPIVACTSVWQHTWSYGGIPFGVGRPENVVSAPAYRNRGLVRALFEMFHARSAARGDMVQAITGIPYYYRQFGYEYVLELSGERTIPLQAIPEARAGEQERYHLRLATLNDVATLLALYNQSRPQSLVWHETDERYWRYHISGWQEPIAQEKDAVTIGFNGRVHMIVDKNEQVCGYVWMGAKRWGAGLDVYAIQMKEGVNWQEALPCLLRLLRQHGESLLPIECNEKAFRQLHFALRSSHPLHLLLDSSFGGESDPPYAWYLRVADVPAFIRHISPALEDRLARSPLTGHTGELLLNFYRGGLRLEFVQGKLVRSEPWVSPVDEELEHAGCPPLLFLQLLFGYRSLAELQAVFPDLWTKKEAALLLNILFPRQPSSVYSLSFT